MSPSSFPRAVPCPGTAFPPQGPSGRFPRLLGTTQCSDCSTLFTPCFVSFASALPPLAPLFAPQWRGRVTTGHGSCSPGSLPVLRDGVVELSQVPGGPCVYMPCSQTPAGERHQAFRCAHFAFRVSRARRLTRPRRVLPPSSRFGARLHGLHTRCLRFAARLTPNDTAQDSLPAGG
jgi:hypothetical protein